MKLTIENKKLHDINPGMYGLFFEDINYAADGGLYAEMIENRSFEFFKTTGTNDAYSNEYDGTYAWEKYPVNCPFVAMETKTEKPLTKENPHYLHIRTRRGNSGFYNRSFGGLELKKDMNYKVSFYARTDAYDGEIKAIVEKKGDVIVSNVFKVKKSKGWNRFEFKFVSPVDISGAHLAITLVNSGEADFDFVSMFPGDAVMGIFRKDLADILRDMKPGFLRFPGGCIIEGNNLENRYQWKRSVGDPKTRIANWNRWAVHGTDRSNNYTTKYSHYNQTLGIGYFEYFLLCEYIGAKALPVVNVGLACQYQCHEWVETTDPAFKEYIQDALDLIEFANGDVSTKWGKLRAEMGHPKPFKLELMGIGNEQWETEQVNFFERYSLFEKAIHKKYPDMKLIGSAGPDVHTERYEAAWNFYRSNKDKANHVYAVDEHYYMAPAWFLDNTHFYDEYDRDVKVFSGEYAAHPKRLGSEKSGNTLQGALAEAAFLTGVERNSDVVIMASYAPLLAREGFVQWAPDMIWFDGRSAYGTPSYYVQSMYMHNSGNYTLKINGDAKSDEKKLFYSASYDKKTKEIVLKIVNASEKAQKIQLDLKGFKNIQSEKLVGTYTELSGEDLYAFNSIENPKKVSPITGKLGKAITMPKYSFRVYRISSCCQ